VEKRERGGTAIVLLTVVAAPFALALETLLRTLLFPSDFELVRELLSPAMTVAAWALVGVTALASVAGVALQERLADRAVARIPEAARTAELARRARLGAFMLAASVPQVPAILATFAFTFGASLVPVAVTIAVVTAGVVAVAVRAR
jgi:hypothetical protein